MSHPPAGGRVADLVARYVALSLAQPFVVLAAFALLTVLAAWRGTLIELDTDLKSLLPQDAPSVVAIEEARQRRVGSDLFVIAVESPEPLATARFIDAIAERLEGWEEIEYVEYEQDRSFFRKHALLFLPVPELERMQENLRRMVRREQGRQNPLYVDLETEDDPEDFDWRDPDLWISTTTLAEMGIDRSEVTGAFDFVSDDKGSGEAAPRTAEELEDQRIRQARRDLPREYRDYRFSPNGRVAVFTAQLRGRSTDIAYARRVYEHAEGVIAELDPASFHPEMRAMVAGAYRSFLDVKAVARDVQTATTIAIGLVLVLVIAFFRNVRSVFIVMVPLLCGVAWTLGLIEVVYGRLNTLTAFVFSILIGMGIDFAIHIYGRAREEFANGAEWQEALTTSLTRTGRGLVSATLTTVAALLTLLVASVDGFREFGVACGLGVAICLVSTMSLVPPLVGAAEKIWPLRRKATRVTTVVERRGLIRAVRIGAIAMLALVVLGFAEARMVEFEYDFGNLEAPREGGRIAYGSALGRNRSSAPAIILGRDEEQIREVHMELRRRFAEGDPLLRGYTTIETLVPADQSARMEEIVEIGDLLERRAFRNLEGDEGDFVDELLELTDTEVFGLDDMPDWAKRQLVERDGTIGGMGLLYGEYDSDDAREVRAFQEAFAEIPTSTGPVRVSSNGFIIADVVRLVQADGRRLAVVVTLVIFVILLLDFRRLGPAVACLLTLTSGVIITLTLMVAFDVKLGLYNMVVLPTILGTGIDASIHLYHRHLEEGPGRIDRVMQTTGVAVLASSATTLAGFVGLLLVEHRGVISIGALAVCGMAAVVASAITIMPAALSLPRGRPDAA
jgi:predicted RND superfamily exporter protein